MPSRPSEPRIISRTLGPFEALGMGRMTTVPPGRTRRRPLVMSAMSPYLSDCMPDERVAIQPPSVECVKLSGKWPIVQPLPASCSSRSGPSAPAWMRASPASESISRTRFMRPMSSEITMRFSVRSGSRLPPMLLPPPNGMITALAATAISTICWISDSVSG